MCLAGVLLQVTATAASAAGVALPHSSSLEGYVCRLLINEVPFPGERGYRSEKDTMAAMDSLLNVLDSRLQHIPPGYTQQQIAMVRTSNIIDVITAGGPKGQFDGFYRDSGGKPVMVPRVGERIDRLVGIANQGAPGRFALILNHAVAVSKDYLQGKAVPPNLHAGVTSVESVPATGRAYSWMTDEQRYHPGGNYLRIPDGQTGSLGGNRFFTLRKNPR